MEEKRYIISDASKILNVESHVLRYWEEELEIKIPRNEMGHRYYTERDLEKLRNVRDLKRQGYGLRSIRMMINGEMTELQETKNVISREDKMNQFKEIMNSIVLDALKESKREIGSEIGKEVGNCISDKISTDVTKEVSKNLINEMDIKLKEREAREEERYKKLDEAIRSRQKQAKKIKEKKPREKKKDGLFFWHKNKHLETT